MITSTSDGKAPRMRGFLVLRALPQQSAQRPFPRQLRAPLLTDLGLSPSMQDDGTVVVPNQDGFMRVLASDGTKKSGPWINPAPGTFNTALNWADAAATGNFYLTAQI